MPMTAVPISPPLPGVWWKEPAKVVAHILSVVIAFTTLVAAILTNYTGIVPSQYRGTATTIVGIMGAIALIAAQAQGWLTRAKVYSPASATVLYNTPPGKVPLVTPAVPVVVPPVISSIPAPAATVTTGTIDLSKAPAPPA